MTQQEKALQFLKDENNVFITGEAGTGKSYLLTKMFLPWCKKNDKEVVLTATTGIAARNIGGSTIHSFSKIGIAREFNPAMIKQAKNWHDWQYNIGEPSLHTTHVLVIDEISMLHDYQFKMVDEICRYVHGSCSCGAEDTSECRRKITEKLLETHEKRCEDFDRRKCIRRNACLRKKIEDLMDKKHKITPSTEPFGGIQIVLSGDFFQLPPVSKSKKLPFIFGTSTWRKSNIKCCYLTEVYRQNTQDPLYQMLQSIRNQDDETKHFSTLRRQQSKEPPKNVLNLFSHNADVQKINDFKLARIKEPLQTFYAFCKSPDGGFKDFKEKIAEAERTVKNADLFDTEIAEQDLKSLKNRYKAFTKFINSCQPPYKLELKVGAKILFVANDPEGRYVNGSVGKVVDFIGYKPKVVVTDVKDATPFMLSKHEWTSGENPKTAIVFLQYPIKLGWAITIHKSQGMTLNEAHISLRRAFMPAIGYVALSRLTGIAGLYVKDFNKITFQSFPEAVKIDKKLKQESVI